MKIIYLHQYFTLPSSPGSTRSFDLSQKFIESGHQVEVITLGKKSSNKVTDRWTTHESDNMIIHTLNNLYYDSSLSKFQRIVVFIKFFWLTTFKLLHLKGDLVLATSTPLTIGIPAIIKKWVHSTPFIFEVRDVWPEAVIAIGAIKNLFLRKLLFGLEGLIYRNSDAIIPLSTDMKSSIEKRFKHLKKPMTVIPNISELGRFKNGINPNLSLLNKKIGFTPRFSILYAGAFGQVNGLHYIVELAAKLFPIDPSITFILMGFGSEIENITKLANERKVLNRNLFVIEPVTKNVLPQMYYECDMGSSFVIPITELWANSANKFFDTLAANKPVLINYEGWQKKALIDYNAGFVLPHDINQLDNNTIIEKFVLYTNNSDLYTKQCDNALTLAKKYSLEEAGRKYNEIFSIIEAKITS